jgi:hypothetical protein
VGPRDGLDGCENISPPPGFDPRTIQPVASRYTDYAVSAHLIFGKISENKLFCIRGQYKLWSSSLCGANLVFHVA